MKDTVDLLPGRNADEDIRDLMSMSEQIGADWVTPRRYNHTNNIRQEDLTYQATTEQVAEGLLINKSDIGKLVDVNLLSPLKPMRTSRDMLFDVRTIILDVPTQATNIHDDRVLISYNEVIHKKYLKYFGANLSELIIATQKGDLHAIADGSLIAIGKAIYDRKSLNDYFDNRLLISNKDISIREASSILNVNTKTVLALINNKHLITNHWQHFEDVNLIDV